mmetsp:Transcript_106001/g.167367  ORF Transcript_106001/g.167367 Transcript_106001/m.167367 type:complete len:423 (+) Transcript_106001:54-1322(+)
MQSNGEKTAKLLYRDYCDADDAQCKALEMRAMQGGRFPALQKVVSFFVKAGFEHFETFDAKAKQYEDYIIRVVEDTSNGGRLVGVCCAALKKVMLHSNVCTIGYVFDLRVDEEYQGYRIGFELSSQIETMCAQRGASFLYLTVNNDNMKAKSLYKKLGYQHASHRSPALKLLFYEEEVPSDILVESLSTEEALEMTVNACKKSDLAPIDMTELFSSKCYEGTFLARRGESYAGISSWNGSSLTGFRVERLIFPIAWWSTWIAKIGIGSVALGSLLCWARVLIGVFVDAIVDSRVRTIAKFGLASSVTCFGIFGLLYARPALSFVASKLASGNRKMRHRSFGPFGHGPMAEQKILLEAVLKALHNRARDSGYAISLCNLDKAHPLRGSFASSKFTTTFLYKQLGTSRELSPFEPDNFFDPRDL